MAGSVRQQNITVAVRQLDETRVLAVTGELDQNTVGLVHGHLDDVFDADAAAVVADFAGVRFCSSAGLHLVEELHRRSVESRIAFSLVVVSPIAETLTVLDLPSLRLHPTLSAALTLEPPRF
ncbi:STAS domain-containing protein [Amycolatopsis sp. NPDC004378]